MKITPLDIRRKEFKRSVRGYSDEEVDIFLDEVADEFERIFQENMELQERSHRLDEQISGHTQLRDALEKTLIAAQLQAEEIRANAHKESELILRDADMKARSIVSESHGETQRTQQALVQLKLLEEDFRLKFRSLLEGYLRLLCEAPLTVTGPEGALGGVETAAKASPDSAKATSRVAPVAEEPTPTATQATPVATPQPAATRQPAATPQPAVPVAQRPGPELAPQLAMPVSGPAQGQEDEAPTEENLYSTTEETEETEETETAVTPPAAQPEVAVADRIMVETSAAETAPSLVRPVPGEGEGAEPGGAEPARGFFFGKQIGNLDDTFAGEDGIKKDKTRDFEW